VKKLSPLHDRVLIKRINIEEKTKGGIFIPNSAREKPLEGKVLAVGPGKIVNGNRELLTVKIGDKILFSKYSETEIEINGEMLLLLREDDILGIVN
jgi:chaperonin GroES